MEITTKFNIFEHVLIADEIKAEIIGIRFDGYNMYYKVEYWFNGENKVIELFEHQIKGE